MATNILSVTDNWIQIANGPVTITITDKKTNRRKGLNFADNGTGLNQLSGNWNPGEQLTKNDSGDTYVQSDDTGWTIRIEGSII